MTKYYTLVILNRDPFTMPRSANAIEPIQFSGKRNAVATATSAVEELLAKNAERNHGVWQLFPPAERDADHWEISGVVIGHQNEVLYHVCAGVTGSTLCDHKVPNSILFRDTLYANA